MTPTPLPDTDGGNRTVRSRNRLTLALAGLALFFLSGCASDAPLDSLEPQGSKAELIDDLVMPVFVIAGVIFLAVFGAVVYIAWKFRVRKPKEGDAHYPGDYPDEEFPAQTHGHFALEITWTVVPFLLLVVIGVFSVNVILELEDVEASPDAAYPEMEVMVVGQQWWWEYQYHLDGDTSTPPDLVTANELIIPVGQEIRIQTTSRDVIHSFWIPRLNGKKDAVPGRVTPWVIQANDVGRFAGTCTEFCGLSHAYMRMYTVALEAVDFDAWVDQQQVVREPLAEGDENYEGQQLFLQNCQRCHAIFGVTERDRDGDDSPEPDDLAMYGDLQEYRDLTDGSLSQGRYLEPGNLTAGAAPNLTHFASRSSYAGSFFELYPDAQEISDAGDYLELNGNRSYRSVLEAWLRNPPAEKPNAQPFQARGMPDLGLSEADIDALADYLLSLD